MVFNTYHHTRTCLDKKIEIDEKNFKKFFSLPISLRATLKRSLRTRFWAKKQFFVFYRNFGFNLEISSYHYSQLKKHLKVDPETRSYDFLTKTREKKSGNIRNMKVTLEKRMFHQDFFISRLPPINFYTCFPSFQLCVFGNIVNCYYIAHLTKIL